MENIIKQLVFGKFFSEYFAENLDELSNETIELQKHVQGALARQGNLAEAHDAYFVEYFDGSSLVFYLRPDSDGLYVLDRTPFKMRFDNNSPAESLMFNDAHPDDYSIYSATLTISKNISDHGGHLFVVKHPRAENLFVRCVGLLFTQMQIDEIQDEHLKDVLLSAHETTKFIEQQFPNVR